MDTSRISKLLFLFFVSLVFTCTSCYDYCNEENGCSDCCNNKDTVELATNMVYFKQKGLIALKKDLKILHIRNGVSFENLPYQFSDSNRGLVFFESPNVLLKSDSIVFSFSESCNYILHGFRSSPNFGGKKFLGCEVEYCIINDYDSCNIEKYIVFSGIPPIVRKFQ